MTKDATPKRTSTPIPRETSLDAVRGLAALAIIWMHTLFWSGLNIPMPPDVRLMSLLMDVPIFLVLAGMVLGQHKDPSIALRGVLRLYAQYVLFMALCFAGMMLLQLPLPPGEPLNWLLFTFADPVIPGVVLTGAVWFIPAYIVSTLMVVLLCPLKSYLRWSMLTMMVATIALCAVEQGMEKGLSNLWTLFFCSALVLLGVQLSRMHISVRWLTMLTAGVCAMLAAYAYHAGQWLPDLNEHKFPHDRVYLLYSLPSFLVLLWMRTLEVAPKFLVWVGRIAMPVFLAQGISGTLLYFVQPYTAFAPYPVQIAVNFTFNASLALLLGMAFAALWKRLSRRMPYLRASR